MPMPSRLFATVALAAASTLPLATAVAQCGTQWIGTGGVPGVASRSTLAGQTERINGTGLWDPDGPGPATARLVMVGYFELAGTVISPKIAAWDPATGAWSAIAPVTIDAIGQLSCVLALPNGDLLVGGYFTTFNGAPISGIARLSGGVWSPLGAGLNGEVLSIVRLANGDLIATGSFSASGAVPVASIARWDGVAWSPLGSGLTRATGNGQGRALAVLPTGDVVVGGSFTMAGGVAAGNIARWNGTTWAPFGAGLPPLTTAHGVHCLAIAPNGDVVAGGFFTLAGGAAADYLVRWNGSTWSAIGGGIDNIARSVAFAANGELFVGGSFMTAGGQPASRVARWNGTAWAPLAQGVTPTTSNSAVHALTALPGGDVVLAGQFGAAGGAMHLAR